MLKQESSPFLTIVAAARNDNRGDNIIHRIHLFINGLSAQCKRHGLKAELVLVEWNPPPDRPRLSEALNWSEADGPLSVRIIEVSPEIHNRFRNSDTIPFFQMIAKNVGIRRARAPFVLVTNPDVIFSDKLISFLASGRLDPKHIYTTFCYKVPSELPGVSIDENIRWCRKNSLPICPEDAKRINNFPIGRLQREQNSTLWWEWHVFRRRFIRPIRRIVRQQIHRPFSKPTPRADDICNAFVIMSKDAWEKTQGYFELPIYPLYLHRFLIYTAASLGFRQAFLSKPMRPYHIDHNHIILDRSLEERVRIFAHIPWLDVGLGWGIEKHFINGGEPIMLNEKDWGLAQHRLPEFFHG